MHLMKNNKSIISAFVVNLIVLAVGNIGAQQTKTHEIGKIHDAYKDMGSMLFKDKHIKMRWDDPGIDGISTNEDLIHGSGVWVGSQDFTDLNGTFFPYYVTLCGFSSEDEGIPVSIVKRLRYQKPVITVIDGSGSYTEAEEVGAEVVPDLVSDESIVAVWKTSLGVTITRTTYAFGQPGKNEFIFQDYILSNTGDMDEDDEQEQNLPLQQFWFGLTYMPNIGRSPADDRFGYIGRDFATGMDPLRIFYHWDGDYSGYLGFDENRGAVKTEPDDTGDPEYVDGSIRFQPYIGFAVLHADTQPHDSGTTVLDDNTQPRTVYIEEGDHIRHTSTDANQILYGEISRNLIIEDADDSGFIEWQSSSRIRTMLGFGPYNNFNIGQEIRIIIVGVIGGVSTKITEKVGQREFDGLITKEERLSILATGLDSLLQNAFRAKETFEGDFNIPDPPPPPSTLTVSSQGGHVYVEWDDDPRFTPDFDSGVLDFAGYRIYRAEGSENRNYELKKIVTKEQLENGEETTTFKDFEVSRGVAYYYRVTSYDDGSQHWLEPGNSLESANTAGNTARGVGAFSQPISSKSQLGKIKVVPNPYNIFGVYNFPGGALQRNKLLFVNLPAVCTIRIFTPVGDLVTTIQHTDGSGDEEWGQITQSDQFILSGIYVAHIQSDLGDQIVKFVIVR